MKITDIEVLRMQAHVEPHNNWLFVRVHTDAGISGIGEGSLQYKDDALQAEIEAFARFLRGKDPMRIEELWTSMHRRVTWTGGAVTLSAISAIDLALWDIKGKHFGAPVWELLGGKCRDKIRLHLLAGGATPESMLKVARDAAEEGFAGEDGVTYMQAERMKQG